MAKRKEQYAPFNGFEDITGYSDPSGAAVREDSVKNAIELVLANSGALTTAQANRLLKAIPLSLLSKEVVYTSGFDVAEEVNQQVILVRAMRDRVQDPITGQILDGIPVREAKEVVAASNTQIATLMKFHAEIVNFDRLRRIEQAVVETLAEMDLELKQRFLDLLEQRLADK